MTICDKINTVGTTLQENLNDRGVACTYGVGTGKSTLLDMANLINENNLLGIGDNVISITASRPYLLEDETTDLIILLKNGIGQPLSNKTITVSDGTNTYNGITNSNGEYTLYNITVTEDTTFTATYGTVSDSVDVFLCTSVDYGTINKHTDIWQSTNATISREDAYSLLTETTATGSCMLNSSNKIPPSKTVELDFCQVDGGNTYAPLYIRNDGGGASLGSITYYILGATVGEWIHLRIVFSDSNTATVYSSTLNEPLALTLSNTSTNYRIMFNATGTITKIQFKNVAIY